MPYDPNSGQATAAFLSIKRSKGLSAAKAFCRKHRKELSAAAKKRGKHRRRGSGYVARSKQGHNHFTGHQSPPAFMNGTQA